MAKTIGLWKYNKTTGYWKLVRDCHVVNAENWLSIWKQDEPAEEFKLSRKRPS